MIHLQQPQGVSYIDTPAATTGSELHFDTPEVATGVSYIDTPAVTTGSELYFDTPEAATGMSYIDTPAAIGITRSVIKLFHTQVTTRGRAVIMLFPPTGYYTWSVGNKHISPAGYYTWSIGNKQISPTGYYTWSVGNKMISPTGY